MSEIGQNLKNIVIKGIDMLGSKASDFASTAKQKVDSFNLENQKKELLAEIGAKVYEMSREGAEFPEAFQDVLKTLEEIDSQLVKLRETKKENPAEEQKEGTPAEDSEQPVYNDTAVETSAAEKGPAAAEYAAKDDRDVPVIELEPEEESEKPDEKCPLSSAINDLFENMPQVDKMMEKVNSSLDDLGENLLKFSGEFDKQLSDLTDQITGRDKDDPKE